MCITEGLYNKIVKYYRQLLINTFILFFLMFMFLSERLTSGQYLSARQNYVSALKHNSTVLASFEI